MRQKRSPRPRAGWKEANSQVLLEIIPGRGLHIRTRQESWLISLPEELQSDELLQAITSGEVNCLSGPCEPYEQSPEFSRASENDKID